jgi:hypothetical protein
VFASAANLFSGRYRFCMLISIFMPRLRILQMQDTLTLVFLAMACQTVCFKPWLGASGPICASLRSRTRQMPRTWDSAC